MSTNVLTDQQKFGDESPLFRCSLKDRAVAEYFDQLLVAARVKDAELIQRFVDHNDKWLGKGCIEADIEWDNIVLDCIKAGYKPSEP